MKFVLMFMLASVLQLSAGVYGQVGKVTLQMENATFEEVMRALEGMTGYTFVYQDSEVAGVKNLDLNYTDTEIREVLNACLTGTGLTWRLVDEVIVISSQKKMAMKMSDTLNVYTAKGYVYDEKQMPLPGVTVRVVGTTVGTATNDKGWFSIDLPTKDVKLEFSFIGYEKQQVTLTGRADTLTVVMKEDVAEIDEVVVTGIFNKPKESFTGAVRSVTKEEIQANFSRNLLQTLSNLEPSLRIIQNNDAGSDPNVLPELQLRGSSTLVDVLDMQQASRTELNTPLFIMDGFEISLERVMDLNQNEVENITVLKDASATALYGARGANGVIVITTTRPKAGKIQVSYRGEVRLEIPDLSTYDMANAKEKLQLEYDCGIWDDEDLQLSYEELKKAVDEGVDYDWMDVPVRTGVGQNHMLNIMGGSEEWRFRLDLSYNLINGAMKGSDRENLNATLMVDYTHDKWYVMQSFSLGTNNSANSPYGDFSSYVSMNPYWEPYDENGKLIESYSHPLGSGANEVDNPLYDWSVGNWNETKYTVLRSNTSMRYEVLPGFQITGAFSISRKFNTSDLFKVPSHKDFAGYEINQKGRFTRRESTEDSWQVRGGVNYTKTFKEKHMLTLNLSGEVAEEAEDEVTWSATGFVTDDVDHPGTSLGYPNQGGTSGYDYKNRRITFNGSLNYYYDMRYFLDVVYNMNGASSFGEDSRWGGFYSFGGGWNMANERFIQENAGFINNFRLRYSFGVSGNMGFNPADAMTTFRVNQDETYLSSLGVLMYSLANPNLKWQNTYQHNVGMDISLFNNRLSFEFNYFNKLTNNTVTDMAIPISHGFDSYKGNIGKIRNIGYDFSVSGYILRNTEKRLMWSVTGRFYHLKNTIVELSEGMKKTVELLSKTMDTASTYYRYIEGESMDAIYGLRTLGVDPLSGNRLFLSKDGEITFDQNPEDLVYLGDRQPSVNGNISTSFSYKGLSLNVGFAVRWGGKQENFTELTKGENLFLLYNVDRRALTNSWKKPGDQARYQKYSSGTSRRTTFPCDMFVHKDNVFSCTNINVTYMFPQRWVNKLRMNTLSVNVNLSDIFYLSTIERQRGVNYPFSINPNFSISCSF